MWRFLLFGIGLLKIAVRSFEQSSCLSQCVHRLGCLSAAIPLKFLPLSRNTLPIILTIAWYSIIIIGFTVSSGSNFPIRLHGGSGIHGGPLIGINLGVCGGGMATRATLLHIG